ncbi:MAG: hypothetical protein JWN48_2330 [Myxococcaceae bacterium]|nr:hypothetical protein [Myxococcaceae bacterium]
MSDPTRVFSGDYVSARTRFRLAASDAGFELLSYPIGQRGPDGSDLSIDVALRGPNTASRALVISSGMHGIEGYFGSAVQLAWLTGQGRSAPEGPRTVLIHALNPYGFAWRRRVDEDNLDLNRNFMKKGQAYQGVDPAYREFDPVLNPARPPRAFEPFLLEALPLLRRHGFRALKNAVAQGQYEYPRGLFYGGARPSRSHQLLAAHMPAWLGNPERVTHIDLHTGRGRHGSYALCADLPTSSPRVAKLRARFGKKAVETFDPSGVLYEIRGALGPWLEELFPSAEYDCLLAEFGTYNAIKVLEALRYESLAHHYASQDVQLMERARRRLFEVFCPASKRWRRLVLERALGVLDQASR